MDVPSNHRPVVLLVAVILAQVLLLAFQIKRDHDVRLVRLWSAALLMPLQHAGTVVAGKAESAWFGYLDLRHAREENRRLTDEVGRLKLENQQLKSRAAESVRLARLVGFRQSNSSVPMLAAEVIGGNADPNSHTVFLNRGQSDGLRRNMPVVTPDGVVGKIFEVFPHTAEVLLITDRESGVGALLSATRTHGVVKGTGDGLWMDYVSNEVKPQAGEEIFTSGEDRVFPKDLPIGIVHSSKTGFPFLTIGVQPAAHLDQLEEVLVLLSDKPLNPRESGGSIAQEKPEQKPAQKPPQKSQPLHRSAEAEHSNEGARRVEPSSVSAAGAAKASRAASDSATAEASAGNPPPAKSPAANAPAKTPATTPTKPAVPNAQQKPKKKASHQPPGAPSGPGVVE